MKPYKLLRKNELNYLVPSLREATITGATYGTQNRRGAITIFMQDGKQISVMLDGSPELSSFESFAEVVKQVKSKSEDAKEFAK